MFHPITLFLFCLFVKYLVALQWKEATEINDIITLSIELRQSGRAAHCQTVMKQVKVHSSLSITHYRNSSILRHELSSGMKG